jgi:sulfite dehydrogenase (quinone) subunit SoeC
MRPALSVLFLTTLIGVGQGLFLALFTAQTYAVFGLLPPADHAFYVQGSIIALVFLFGGLVASFFHLGRPERAWRAATQWRTSWLAREVIVLPALMAAVFVYAIAHGFGWNATLVTLPSGVAIDASLVVGCVGAALAFALFVCTAMIYACLPFVREWASPLTVVNYVLQGGASGFTLASALSAMVATALTPFFCVWSIVLTLLAFAGRAAAIARNRRLTSRSSLQTAIGIKHPRIVQTARGFTGASFATREFFHGRSGSFVRRIEAFYLVAAFALPVALLAAGTEARVPPLIAAAFVVQYLGLLAERWTFFAQAHHPQNLYYAAAA